jgi:hypothetical protein
MTDHNGGRQAQIGIDAQNWAAMSLFLNMLRVQTLDILDSRKKCLRIFI